MEQEQNARARTKVAGLLTDRLKEIWGNFMEEFQQSFDLNQLDLVCSVLRELESSIQTPAKKSRTQFMQKEEAATENNYHQSSLENKVFGNHLLAKPVFQYLSNSDLLSCRLMNSHWNEYATEILLKRELEIGFQRKVNRYYLRGSNWRSLDMFTQLLRTSKLFPCNRFVFWGGNLGNDDAQRFFSLYGPAIKGIKISLNDENRDVDKIEVGFSVALTDSRIIGMILSDQLLNLEHFNLNLFHDEEYAWAGFQSLLFPPDKHIVLPNLKTLTYNARKNDQDFLRQLLSATNNLQTFEFEGEYFVMDYLNLFIETGKIKSIYEASFRFGTETDLEELEKMVEYGPEVTCLIMCDLYYLYKNPELWGKVSTVLSKFLASSQKSLNELNLYSLGFLRQLQLPVLENVKELHLKVLHESVFNPQDIHDYSFAFLPRGATFSRIFPRLSSLEILLCFEIFDAASLWKKCFPTNEIVPTVKKLNIYKFPYRCYPLLWIEKFGTTFPNLESVSVQNITDFPNFSKIIWTNYTKLTFLGVEIDLSSPLNSRPFMIDSSVAGISPEICKTLEKQTLSTLEQIGDNFSDNPSILNLKDLRTLDITFRGNYQENQRLDSTNFLTQISGPCAFNLLDNLKSVNIFVYGLEDKNKLSRIKESLEPLKTYKVNIK